MRSDYVIILLQLIAITLKVGKLRVVPRTLPRILPTASVLGLTVEEFTIVFVFGPGIRHICFNICRFP